MSTITIRNLPPELVERLKDRAGRQGHSMEREVREILGYHLMARGELLDQVQARWPQLPYPPSADEVAGWIKGSRGEGE